MLHATVLMCWLGAGCMFWVADEAFDNVKACEIKVEEVVVAVIDANGVPSLADPKCMTVDELNEAYKEYKIDKEVGDVGI